MLPEWLDVERLRWIALGVLALLAVAAFLVLRFVQKMVLRLAMLAVLAALAVGVWLSRAELGDCARTCSCELVGQQVHVPACERFRQ